MSAIEAKRNQMTSRPCVWCSEIAALIGAHKFQSKEVALGKFRAREFGVKVPEVKARCPKRALEDIPESSSEAERCDAAYAASLHQQRDAEAAVAASPSLTAAVSSGTRLPADALAAVSPRLRDAIQSEADMANGRLNEARSLQQYEQKAQCAIVDKQNKYKRSIKTPAGNEFVIFGRIDGSKQNEGVIIEAKQRQRRLFGCIPDYERPQLLAYMFLTQCTECVLVETFNDESLEHRMCFDTAEWQDIVEKLGTIVDNSIRQTAEFA